MVYFFVVLFSDVAVYFFFFAGGKGSWLFLLSMVFIYVEFCFSKCSFVFVGLFHAVLFLFVTCLSSILISSYFRICCCHLSLIL